MKPACVPPYKAVRITAVEPAGTALEIGSPSVIASVNIDKQTLSEALEIILDHSLRMKVSVLGSYEAKVRERKPANNWKFPPIEVHFHPIENRLFRFTMHRRFSPEHGPEMNGIEAGAYAIGTFHDFFGISLSGGSELEIPPPELQDAIITTRIEDMRSKGGLHRFVPGIIGESHYSGNVLRQSLQINSGT